VTVRAERMAVAKAISRQAFARDQQDLWRRPG
jgi:hypothetical protein